METTDERQNKVYLGFIDYENALDYVNHELLWIILKNIEAPQHII